MSKLIAAQRERISSPVPAPPISHGTQPVSAGHLRFGWWSLLIWLTFGILLETLHGFKTPAYLAVSNETRRLMWTLAHAHGTLLAVINIAFGLSAPHLLDAGIGRIPSASKCLYAAALLVPAGFFLGGAFHYSGTPGIGILLVPTGGLLLVTSIFLTALSVKRS